MPMFVDSRQKSIIIATFLSDGVKSERKVGLVTPTHVYSTYAENLVKIDPVHSEMISKATIKKYERK